MKLNAMKHAGNRRRDVQSMLFEVASHLPPSLLEHIRSKNCRQFLPPPASGELTNEDLKGSCSDSDSDIELVGFLVPINTLYVIS